MNKTPPLRPRRTILGMSAVLMPFTADGAVDWPGFESLLARTVDAGLVEAARTLGAGPARVFARVALPLAAGGLGTAAAVAFARGLGEFGATIMFAGSLQGVTQTLPLAIYAAFATDLDTAVSLGVLLVVVSAAILLAVKLVPSWTRFALTSPFRSAPSA